MLFKLFLKIESIFEKTIASLYVKEKKKSKLNKNAVCYFPWLLPEGRAQVFVEKNAK